MTIIQSKESIYLQFLHFKNQVAEVARTSIWTAWLGFDPRLWKDGDVSSLPCLQQALGPSQPPKIEYLSLPGVKMVKPRATHPTSS